MQTESSGGSRKTQSRNSCRDKSPLFWVLVASIVSITILPLTRAGRLDSQTVSEAPVAGISNEVVGACRVGEFLGFSDISSPTRVADHHGSRVLGGVWGELEIEPVNLQAPAQLLKFAHRAEKEVVWNVSVTNRAEVKGLLEDCGFDKKQVEELLSRANWNEDIQQWEIKPDSEFVTELESKTRAKFYSRLAGFANNREIAEGGFLYNGRIEDWIDGNSLGPDSLALFRKLVFSKSPTSGWLTISDGQFLLNRIGETAENDQLCKTLFKTRALMLSLIIGHREDVEELADYWGVGDHRFLVEPVLNSMSSKAGGGKIDIVHLLPRFTRVRLNTYPYRDEYLSGGEFDHDCLWAAMNFFNEIPDARFSSETRMNIVESITIEIPAPSRFGDIILLFDDESNLLHACNYVAANVVFTKNGGTPFTPFVFSYIQDVLDLYGITKTANISCRRLSEFGPTQLLKTGNQANDLSVGSFKPSSSR